MTRDVTRIARTLPPLDLDGVTVRDAAYRVLQFPAVADKTFLVTIGDRTVGGLCSRDPMVGPWQVPVADVAVTLMDFDGYAGEAMAIGERTPLALIDAPASGRMAVAEAITNIAAAGIRDARRRQAVRELDGGGRTSGRGRRAVRHGARRRARPVHRRSACRFPSARTRCRCARHGATAMSTKSVTAPVSLIVSAFAPVPDARHA